MDNKTIVIRQLVESYLNNVSLGDSKVSNTITFEYNPYLAEQTIRQYGFNIETAATAVMKQKIKELENSTNTHLELVIQFTKNSDEDGKFLTLEFIFKERK